MARVSRRRRGGNGTRVLFLLPALVLFGVVVVGPIMTNLFYAFTDWDGFGATFQLIGLRNFVQLAGDRQFVSAILHTVEFTVINAPLQIAFGLILALCLTGTGTVRAILRTVIVLPIAISGVVLGFLGNLIFDPRSGLLTAASKIPGLSWLSQNWLGNPTTAMGAIITMNIWQWTGFTVLIFIAGLSTQPVDLLEAATLDGAGPWRRFWDVKWPLLAPSVTVNVVLTVIGGLKVFDIVYVLTKGGPAGATETAVARIALEGAFGRYGYSAASNFTLTVLMLIVSLILLRILRRRELSA